jgi:hypothetical protein
MWYYTSLNFKKSRKMINPDDYAILKQTLLDQERLFIKLDLITNEYEESQLLEIGFYFEDEEKFSRRWLTLSSKIVDALAIALEGYNVELLRNVILDERVLHLRMIKDENSEEIKISYAKDGSLSITQLS